MVEDTHIIVAISHLDIIVPQILLPHKYDFHETRQTLFVVWLFEVKQGHHQIGIPSFCTIFVVKFLDHFYVVNIRVFAFLELFEGVVHVCDLAVGRKDPAEVIEIDDASLLLVVVISARQFTLWLFLLGWVLNDVDIFALLNFTLLNDPVLQLLNLTLFWRKVISRQIESFSEGFLAIIQNLQDFVSGFVGLFIVFKIEDFGIEQGYVDESVWVLYFVGGIQLW